MFSMAKKNVWYSLNIIYNVIDNSICMSVENVSQLEVIALASFLIMQHGHNYGAIRLMF